MKRLLLTLLLSCVSLQLNAKPFKFHDVDWSMTPGEIRIVIEAKGYSCRVSGVEILCSGSGDKDEGFIWIMGDGFVRFTCEVYNGCSHSYEKMIEALSKKYNIKPKYIKDKQFDDIHYWDWNGEDGDKIRIFDDRKKIKNHHEVFLIKGSFGEELDF